MSTTKRGLFVTFEGVDGCGKTTQLRQLARRLRSEGREVIETVEPGGTAIGTAIRHILLDPANHAMGPVAEMLLYFAARAQNVDEILVPALERGAIVLSDRWTDSTLAYQGYGRGLGEQIVLELDRIACRGRKPDLTLWVDLDVDASLARIHGRSLDLADLDRMDQQERQFYDKVREGYQRLNLLEPVRFVAIDGAGSVEEVGQRVAGAFERLEHARV